MEESKKPEMKVVANQSTENAQPQQKKATYEELNNYCIQLSNQNRELINKLQQIDMSNMFRRLDYLFMVLHNEDHFEDKEFVKSCAEEIQSAIVIPKEVQEKAQEEASK